MQTERAQWEAVPVSARGNGTKCKIVMDGNFYALLYCSPVGAPPEEWDRRTALLAAAPDLAEALRKMVSRFDDTSNYGFVRKRDLETARAALAKAGL